MNEPIKDKVPKPPGLLPKNVQSWVIVGVALLMIVIMWLTGGKKPQATAKTTASLQPPVPVDVNETKIAELQTRIQELQRQQLAAQSALAQQTRLLGSLPPDQAQTAQPGPTPNNANSANPEDEIRAERRKREYLSLFASNVALSYRKDAFGSTQAAKTSERPAIPTQAPDSAQVAQLLKDLQPTTPPQQPAPAQSFSASSPQAGSETQSPASDPKRDRKEADRPSSSITNSRNSSVGKTYLIFEGTVLETVLINRLDGQFSGPVECLLTTDVYSHDRQHLLIPAGTKILGETKKVDTFGQTRLAVVFHRFIMPDGYSSSLDKFKGLDQIGDTGLRDRVNNHYLRIFGTSLAIGALGAVAEAGTGTALTSSSGDLMRQGFAASTAQSAAQILDRFLNILPAVTIREGHRVKVYLSGDLALPDYNNHTMPSDL
jgi:type IV secretion system protein TrbI